MARSFIENINLLANATVLAGGDIVDDASRARDEAVAAALAAEAAAEIAIEEELLAADWAKKAYNNPVIGSVAGNDAEFSSYHWSVVSSDNASGVLINDAVTSLSSTWSSTKLTGIAAGKADNDHDHNGDYEPLIVRNTAFNKDFSPSGGSNGTSVIVTRSDHNHTDVYEPLINNGLPKLTAFNKNFGTSPGTVMEGDHLFDDRYMTIATYADGTIIKPTSIPWVQDANAPLATEVSPGNHRHPAVSVDYVPEVGGMLTSGTVQGALSQTDIILQSLSISERCNITGGSSSPTSVEIITPGTYEPILISFDSATSARNCQYNDGIQVYYNGEAGTNPGDEGVRLVEGMWSSTVTMTGTPTQDYSITVLIMEDGGSWVVPNSNFSTDMTCTTAGEMILTITGWISHLAEGTTIGLGITSTLAETIDISGTVATFSGAGDGSVVSTGLIINHADLTGTGAPAGVHTTSDIQDLDVQLLTKADKVIAATPDNFAKLDADGNLQDSGVSALNITEKMDLIAIPTLNNIILMDASGNSLDSGTQLTNYALLNGDVANTFKVAPAVADDDAMQKAGINSLLTNYVTNTIYDAHIAATNPHAVTYTDTGAAALVHTHTTAEVTGLDDVLLDKYSKVVAPASDNFPIFANGELLADSGISITDFNAKIDATDIALKIEADDYATDLVGGTIKILVVGTDAYITTDGSTPGP